MMKFGPNSRETIDLARRAFPAPRPDFDDDDLFIRETSPLEVTANIAAFCAPITGRPPLFVDVVPAPGARAGWCYANVADVIAKEGGDRVHGWTIWNAPGLWNAAEFHVVWKTASGQLVDVTPKPDGERFICFLPDSDYAPNFNFYGRPNNIRERVYGTEGCDEFVAAKIASFTAARLTYEMGKAKRQGLSIVQSVGSKMKGRDRYERIIDEFLKEVGEIEAMLVPTPEGMVCEDPRRVPELRRRAADIEKKTKVFLMADLWVRGMVPDAKE
jgi:hypothetical protein